MLTSLIALSALSQGSTEMRLMRFPTVHGNDVVFTYAADLWIASKDGSGFARRLTSHPGIEVRPFYSPDGSMIAFTGQYDGNQCVYVMPAEGGEPKRLTFEADGASAIGWTPDGKIAYASSYGSINARQRRMWLIDPKGGMPKPTAILEVADACYSPDGNKLAYNRQGSNRFNWRRYRGGSQGVISIYDFRTNSYKELPHGRENSWNPMWIGDSIYYASDKDGKTVNLYRYDLNSGNATEITHYTEEDVKWPTSDGKSIVFENDGYLYSYDIATGKTENVHPKVVGDMLSTRPTLRKLAGQISSFSLSPSGARLAVEARGDLFSVPAKSGETRDLPRIAGSRERQPQWSDDGKYIAFISDASGENQVYLTPQMGGRPAQVTNHSGASIQAFGWSPDGKHIVFSTADGKIFLLDASSKQEKLLIDDPYGGVSSMAFSPDSKWIAIVASEKNLFNSLKLYDVEKGEMHQVTEGYYRDAEAAFDLSGKYLYLISGRTYSPTSDAFGQALYLQNPDRIYVMTLAKDTRNPLDPVDDEEPAGGPEGAPAGGRKPVGGPPAGPPPTPDVKIDLDGLGDRIIALPMPAGNFAGLVGDNNGLFYRTEAGLFHFDLKSKQPNQVLGGPLGPVDFNPTRTKIAFAGPAGICITDVHPGITPTEGRVDMSAVEAVIDPRAEWKQIFWEAWRYERDNYYDSNFKGLDWNAIGQRYSKYLPYVAHRDDLNYVLGLMIGEFGTSHSYVNGGDYGAPVPTIPVGQLGADYEVVDGMVRFKHIYHGEQFEEGRRGPLGDPGVNVSDGDYLLAIDGRPVDADHNPDEYLVDKAGRPVMLTVNSTPSREGARRVEVRPIASEDDLRYIDWVERNRKLVSQESNGRIGYMHVPNTSREGMVEFLKGYYSQSDKDALIVDERWNGGGNIPTFFVQKLATTYMSGMRSRNGADIGFPTQTVAGPKAMLINGYAGSGGDHFPWLFRDAKLGPLIGTRTWGGLVGINGFAPLVDGGQISAPAFGLYDINTGKWIAENNGIEPDIEVDDRPDLVVKGQDPQLEAAIKYLMDELAKHPPKAWKRPDFPKVKSGG